MANKNYTGGFNDQFDFGSNQTLVEYDKEKSLKYNECIKKISCKHFSDILKKTREIIGNAPAHISNLNLSDDYTKTGYLAEILEWNREIGLINNKTYILNQSKLTDIARIKTNIDKFITKLNNDSSFNDLYELTNDIYKIMETFINEDKQKTSTEDEYYENRRSLLKLSPTYFPLEMKKDDKNLSYNGYVSINTYRNKFEDIISNINNNSKLSCEECKMPKPITEGPVEKPITEGTTTQELNLNDYMIELIIYVRHTYNHINVDGHPLYNGPTDTIISKFKNFIFKQTIPNIYVFYNLYDRMIELKQLKDYIAKEYSNISGNKTTYDNIPIPGPTPQTKIGKFFKKTAGRKTRRNRRSRKSKRKSRKH